jgi:hypothetical protein
LILARLRRAKLRFPDAVAEDIDYRTAPVDWTARYSPAC